MTSEVLGNRESKEASNQTWAWVLILVGVAALGITFYDSLVYMEHRWATMDEYSHGYMIPFVAAFLLWQKLPGLANQDIKPTYWSVVFMLVALVGWFLGELSSLFIISHYSFLLALFALVMAIFGVLGIRLFWAALFYLVFLIPLPTFIYNGLSQQLQFLSSEIGVFVVRLFGISVYLEGNVIDLGVYQLQVVEACSGLRYLFPLMSFGFLIAYVYRGPNWHKWLIFLSTVPITVLMNSIRIGLIGVSVEYWGIEMAEGILHDFEGWIVFMACLAVLLVEIWVLNIVSGRREPVLDLIDLNYQTPSELKEMNLFPNSLMTPVLCCVVALTVVAVPVSLSIKNRTEVEVPRQPFLTFPLLRGDWIGRESAIEPAILDRLKLTDYIKADYRQSSDGLPVNFYVAFYESQRKGSSIHSPRSCIPGGGWEISNLSQKDLRSIPGAEDLIVNRLIIQKGEYRQLTYYWFAQRGRVITNEYLAKWHLFYDGLVQNRTDGALVRLVTPILPEDVDESQADERLQQFIKDFYPILPRYIPGQE